MEKYPNLIVFYDGDCGLCNTSVQFVLKHEKSNEIYFSPLQSDFSKTFFKQNNFEIPDFTTFYFFEKGQINEKSTAVLKLCKYLKSPYSLLQIFLFVPGFIRNTVYDFISKRRMKFSKRFCLVPSIENQSRFL